MDANQPLLAQLFPTAFSLPNAPIWLDSSTTHDCRVLEDRLGGPQALSDLTGSRAYERFTGPQIAKVSLFRRAKNKYNDVPPFQLRRVKPDVYQATARISLVSSFMSSLFLGRIAPIEVSDASGMNLMNLSTCKWDDRLLESCGGDQIYSKLGPEPVPGGTSLGTVSDWWVKRWGFRPGTSPARGFSIAYTILNKCRVYRCPVYGR
jgi:xylulokinase